MEGYSIILQNTPFEMNAIETQLENYCIRANCVTKRKRLRINDSGIVSNIWWDIHRLKHNSRRALEGHILNVKSLELCDYLTFKM